MLELMLKYAEDHGLVTEPGFAPKMIQWALVFDEAGEFVDVIKLGDTEQRRNPGRRFEKCPDLSQAEMVRKDGIRSHFLSETTGVATLYGKNGEEQKTHERHDYFVDLLKKASIVIPRLEKIAEELSSESSLEIIRMRLSDLKARDTEKATIRIGGSFPLESDTWHNWWREFREASLGKEAKPGNEMRCFATGELVEPALTHPKISGLAGVGGNSQGDVFIGFDKDSSRSYGLEQSANAAVSEQAAAAYRAALNHLLGDYGTRIAGAKVIHWFKKRIAPDDDPLPWLEQGQFEEEMNAQEKAKRMLASIRSGERKDLQSNYYYALTLSGASGRVMVRDWMEGRFEALVANVGKWFEDLAIIHRDGGCLAKDPKILAVLGGTVRDLADVPAPQVTKLWRVAIRGEPIPRSALAAALIRAKMDIIHNNPFNHARMGLIKAYHLRKHQLTGGNTMADVLKPELAEGYPNPAYQCGRLMAILTGLQRSALGDVGAGVVQRYYAAASTTPSLVLGRLTRTSQFHLNKLSPGLARWYEDLLSQVWSNFQAGMPRTLNLEEQSLFALGYYQQLADMRKKKNEDEDTDKEVNNE